MNFKGINLCCPHCQGELDSQIDAAGEGALYCTECRRIYPVILGIPDLRVFPDPYIDLEADRAKGRKVAAHLHAGSFANLVSYYYSITPVVPPHHARQYTRGLLAAAARAEASLAAWEKMAGHNGAGGNLLEIGCGTGPLLVAAAGRYDRLVGVDIAFRWLVVAKKRLMEAGLDLPLICACAEALPFPASAFDRVAADSVLEHLHDQRQALAECRRVMRHGGWFFAITPNRYSLGPDPHTGIWAGGYLPDRWTAAIVRRQGGIPPQRRLLSTRSLARLLQKAGFARPQIQLPDIPEGQRTHFGPAMRRLIDGYHLAKRLPVGRQILALIGPLMQMVTQLEEHKN